MAYSTVDGISKKIDQRILIQLLDDESRQQDLIDLTDPADPVVERFSQIANEVAEGINDSLRGRYKLPLSQTSTTIQSISDDMVIYNIKKRRMRDSMPESEQKIFNDSTKQLQQIQRGETTLDLEPAAPDTQGISGEIRVNKTASDRYFSDNFWKMF
ncbi:MAG: DUF1320 family protein [Ignavibacteriales bacterium]|nr:DUF1320 family protein [Ignavibacteriales bacterium]